MDTITFKDGKSYETVAVYGGNEIYQESRRDTMDIIIPADKITLEEAKTLWHDAAATSEITINYSVTEDGKPVAKTGVHINYTLPVSLTLGELDGAQVVRIKLAQKSALEIVLEQQAQDIKDNEAALCELAEIIAGGENNG